MHLRKSCVITGCTSEPNCYSIVGVCVLSINEEDAEEVHRLNGYPKQEEGPSTRDNYKINDASDSATINIILNNPAYFQSKMKPTGIQEGYLCTLDSRTITIESACADNNGTYIVRGTCKRLFLCRIL